MSEAVADATAASSAAPAGKKKLMLVVVALLLLVAIGAGALLYLKKKGSHDGDAEAEAAVPQKSARRGDPAKPPTFLTLEPFIVNLNDKDADRYAQIGIVLEVATPEFAEQMRTYMPAIRNAILMIIAHKTSRELLDRKGKTQLAAEVMRETVRPMGIDIPPPRPVKAKAVEPSDDEVEEEAPQRRPPAVYNPVRQVHFSSFIIQ